MPEVAVYIIENENIFYLRIYKSTVLQKKTIHIFSKRYSDKYVYV